MSFDLMVFEVGSAPSTKDEFMKWYDEQTEWKEPHEYDDPKVTSPSLRSWFMDMIEIFPMMNGPFATDNLDHPKSADYSIGRDIIYSLSCAEEALTKQ